MTLLLGLLLICSGCCEKYHRLGILTDMCFLTVLEGRIQDQGAISGGFWWDLSSYLVDSHLLVISSGKDLWCLLLFLQGHQSYWIRAPPLKLVLILITSLKDTWGLGVQHEFWGGCNSVSNKTWVYHRVSLVAQMVKNLPEMQETRVQSLGQKDALEEGNPNPGIKARSISRVYMTTE